MQPRIILIALLSVAIIHAYSYAQFTTSDERPHEFVERSGLLEFSGMMIVRPWQPSDLAARGETLDSIMAIRDRASARLGEHLVEYIPETDECIVMVPPGQTENSYSRMLMATGDYQYAEPDWICYPTDTVPNDPSYSLQWHHPQVRSPLAWDITTGDPSLVIAIVDGGVQLDHPDLAGALVPGYNSADDLPQSAGGDVYDVDGHGTFVAGLAGAIGNNRSHVTGMGWSFSIMPIRYYNQPGGGYLHNIEEGARCAAENGARCINVSQTGVEYSSVQTTGAYVKSLGSILFWAAGNDQRDLSWFDWDDVVIVGATDPNDNKASFSAYGQAVDLFAPGTDIYSTGMPSVLAIGSGTSASTPMVAGICAMVWSLRPNLTPDQVEQCLFSGCVDLGPPGNDPYWGWGRVDSHDSLVAAGLPPVVDIKANGQDKIAMVPSTKNVEIDINIEANDAAGNTLDVLMMIHMPPGNNYYHHNGATWSYGMGGSFYTGPLINLTNVRVLDQKIPRGTYFAYLALDKLPNGAPDQSNLVVLDSVEIQVY